MTSPINPRTPGLPRAALYSPVLCPGLNLVESISSKHQSHQNDAVRTTIDIPDSVLRRAKAEAALRGMKLKDFVIESLRAALRGELAVRESSPSYGEPAQQRIGEDCVFPVIRGEGGPALRDATSDSLNRLL